MYVIINHAISGPACPSTTTGDEIERAIAANPVVILTAETGAGKSTRVPWWLWQAGKKVHVTQPRRIAARALSNYLARVCDVPWGREIGYQTGLDGNSPPATSLLYLTDGVQMVREIQGHRDYDVLILDEIHEWNLNQEVLVGQVRKNLDERLFPAQRQARADHERHAQGQADLGFPAPRPGDHRPRPRLPGRVPAAPSLLPAARRRHPAGGGAQRPGLPARQAGDRRHHPEPEGTAGARRQKAVILPLHSELSITEQAKVFKNYPLPKAVVATDIAQTSLTIDDIDAVIDSGIKKEVRLVSGIEGLYPTEISASECRQRAGRAGRVKKGYYILCSERGMDDRLDLPRAGDPPPQPGERGAAHVQVGPLAAGVQLFPQAQPQPDPQGHPEPQDLRRPEPRKTG